MQTRKIPTPINNYESYINKIIENDKKKIDKLNCYRTYCDCGHTVFMKPTIDRLICNNCGHWIYRTEEIKKQYEKEDFKRMYRKYERDVEEKMKARRGKKNDRTRKYK